MIRRTAVLSLFAALLAGGALAKAPERAPAPEARPAEFRAASGAERLIRDAGLSGATAAFVVRLSDGVILEAVNPDLALPPASVAKAVTAVYALHRLGADHRFGTALAATGPVEDGVLQGDLILVGDGDPELDSADLKAMAEALVAEVGVRHVEGRFLYDAGGPPSATRIDPTQPEFVAYNPSVAGLNLNYNRAFAEWRRLKGGGYEMSVEARADGASPKARTVEVDVVDSVEGRGPFAYDGGAATERWRVARRALGRKGGRWLPVRRPALYAATTFRDLAEAAGLTLPTPRPGRAAPGAQALVLHQSRPLAEIAKSMLKYSTNLTAEALGVAASVRDGATLSEPLGLSASRMSRWSDGYVGPGAGSQVFAFDNHSGLSGGARVTARRLVEFMQTADRWTPEAPLFDLLKPFGHLDKRAPKPAMGAVVRAKTGTLNFVSALSGYIRLDNGETLAFAIISADLDRRSEAALTGGETATGARPWERRARGLQRALLRRWIDLAAAGAG